MRIIYILCCVLISWQMYSQKRDYMWLIGQNSSSNPEFAGNVIDFTTVPPDIYYEFRDMYFMQTNASMCDTAGNLLFYTNGIYVANALNDPMENGGGLNPGAHATAQANAGRGYILDQGAMIVPVPEKDSLYYLLHMNRILSPDIGTNHSSKYFYYTLININANNGFGAVIEKNNIIKEAVMELGKLTATRHANGRDWWILLRSFNSNNYFTFLVTPDGIIEKEVQSVGESIPSPGVGQAVFSPDGSKFANFHTISQITGLFISVYDFDRCTGILSNPVNMQYPHDGGAGGVAISPNSRFLYVPSYRFIYQYDLWATDIEASKDTIAEWDGYLEAGFFPTTFYLAQLAPDNRIYINSSGGVSSLHIINQPNLLGDSSDVCQRCLDLPSWNSASLPNFPNYRLKHLEGSPCDTLRQLPTAAFDYEIIGNEVHFIDSSYHDIRSWQWDFGDGQVDSVAHPVHEYTESGVYEVCLTVSNPRGEDTLCQVIEVIVTSISEEAKEENSSVIVFPNPVETSLNIELREAKAPAQFYLYNALGQEVVYKILEDNLTTVDVSGLSNGVYWWRVEWSDGFVQEGKVVIF